MDKISCYNCGREIKTTVTKLDIGQGDTFYFHKKCLDKWVKKNSKIVESEKYEE